MSHWDLDRDSRGSGHWLNQGQVTVQEGYRGLGQWLNRPDETFGQPVKVTQGWQCPICKRVLAPTTPHCTKCP